MELRKLCVEAGEYRIPVLELLPEGGGARPAGIVMCPGAGGDKHQILENMVRLSERGFATLSLDGPELGERRTELGIPSVDKNGVDYARRWLELQQQYARDFRAVAGWWLSEGRIDGERLGAWGRSFGANTLYFALQGERRVKAAAAIIGTADNLWTLRKRLALRLGDEAEAGRHVPEDLVERYGPLVAAENVAKFRHVALLACSGGRDPTMPLGGLARFEERWRDLPEPKAPFRHVVFPEADHRATREMEVEWIRWFEAQL